MKIGLIQCNCVVGDLAGNAERLARAVRKAAKGGADLCVTSELALCGYPPRDQLLYGCFLDRTLQAAGELARSLADAPPVVLGAVERNRAAEGKPVFNCAFLLRHGRVEKTFRKTLLPTYDVFDEGRYFEPCSESYAAENIFELDGVTFGVTICEDAWNDKDFWPMRQYRTDPVSERVAQGARVVLNLSASPFSVGKQQLRETMLGAVARTHGVPVVYANQTGGNDDLVFDGRSCAFGPDGRLAARAPGFEEDVLIVDIRPEEQGQCSGSIADDDFTPEAETWRALVLGTRDYVHKSGFKKAVVGLSGGIDSAVTLAVAAHALGRENVTGVLMPSPYSSAGSVDDSLELARRLGVSTRTIPIAPLMQAFEASLAESFEGYAPDVTEENLQSRIRGNLLMALSNKYGALLLTTGNKSELAVGYCTIYGDMCGAFAVISDLPKVDVYRLARWMNDHLHSPLPEAIITKAPSAELRPDQVDQDSLPDYDVLDRILVRYVERHMCAEEIVAEGFDEDVVRKVLRLVEVSEFKRRQAAPGIKISPRSFGTGWRMPLAARRVL